ncbi:MAG: N-acetyl-gamma-glutamyl-phosphate reductase [Bacteroidales bacterium]|nr:N-acetyl-gamma-glutamyl-phosphate reductase [Bacteroidales bacterium]
MIKIGIIGGAGFTAGELLRVLLNHPQAEIVFVNSSSNAGNDVTDVHGGLIGECDLVFTDALPLDRVDVLFLCSAHGDSKKFIEANDIPAQVKIIDLSTDYRQKRDDHDFVYGLPEMNKAAILQAKHISNPGCFATCIQLALLPLAAKGLLKSEINVTGITGSTGAGVKPSSTTHFSWRNDNISVYKAFEHQHLQEIRQSMRQLQKDFSQDINFIPVRGDFARGIFVSAYTNFDGSLEEAEFIYKDFYKDAAFTFVTGKNIDLKQVINTNKCLLHLEKHGKKLLILSVIDNLLKGASGQAVQNMNLLFGIDEKTGLNLKPVAF